MDLSRVDFTRTSLCEANLVAVNLSKAQLMGASMVGADLSGANLQESRLDDSDLSRANLSGANLVSCYLTAANLSAANLEGANFIKTNLANANLTHAQLFDTDFLGTLFRYTTLGNNDLSIAKNLDKVIHFGPSTLGIDTIVKSKGIIPDNFLRGAGVPDIFIDYISALLGKPIEYHSCFISYSNKNQAFADRLHADFQNNNVRCWLATEDLKIGDKFRTSIEESIRMHDKLLLILSETSVASPWVESEVESAMERERRENRLVLFPVRLDDAVMDTNVAWAAEIRARDTSATSVIGRTTMPPKSLLTVCCAI